MKRFALKVAYIGSDFYGFQRQPDFKTVEGEIINTLIELELIDSVYSSKFSIAGRTDRGVHSLGNVIAFNSEKEPIINQINDFLSDDIQIIAKTSVHFGFKPRYSLMKHYRYFLKNFYDDDVDINLIEELAKLFEGVHDFTNFTKRNQKAPIRKIDKIEVNKIDGADKGYQIHVDVFGESFLWNMIRKMMAVFRDVGKGKLDIDKVADYFNPSFKANIKALSPKNLILVDVTYKNIKFQYDDYAMERFQRVLKKKILEYEEMYSSNKNILFSIPEINND
ncbi:MAG: tRNA pseudouridine(38-40) synthase TruA [Methanobrevibacter sp.]|jgi:tRNA pseudouridine38-40 synthase|nr:tRNA pseudouridine(38-40) synthase TruA [Candidatus Methanovirga basalitermitum]